MSSKVYFCAVSAILLVVVCVALQEFYLFFSVLKVESLSSNCNVEDYIFDFHYENNN